MCSRYWNLDTEIVCPKCNKKSIWNLQTHFMGEVGSSGNYYKLEENIPELKNTNIVLDGKNDSFCGDCPKCGTDANNANWVLYDFGAEIVDGKVVKIWRLINTEDKYNG